METRDEILKELREIAPKLAAMEKTNPFMLPEGYFLSFGEGLIKRIKLGDIKAELSALAPELARLEKQKAIEVPAHYFNSFSAKLLKDIRTKEVLNELAEIAPELSTIEKVNLLQAPADYFSGFPQIMAEKMRAQQKAVEPSYSWIDKVNEVLDQAIGVVFKPKYAVAFAGMATMVIVGMMMFIKIQQCNDLDCKFAQLSTDEINNYLNNKSDAYSDEVFEGNFTDVQLPVAADKDNTLRAYKDALKDVDDSALDAAIAN